MDSLAHPLAELEESGMFSEFRTAWKDYSPHEMDRYDLDGEVVYIPRDRSCAFIQGGEEQPAKQEFRQAAEEELMNLWNRHRLVALLPVFRSLQSQKPA
jgi:hypothetical protein